MSYLYSKKSELEKTLDQALSNENWGASGTMLNDIAQASYNEYYFHSIVLFIVLITV